MICLPEKHYQQLLAVTKALEENFRLLLPSLTQQLQPREALRQFSAIVLELTSINEKFQFEYKKLAQKQQKFRAVLVQFEDENKHLVHSLQQQKQKLKENETELMRITAALTKTQKELLRHKEHSKKLTTQLNNLNNMRLEQRRQMEQQFRTEIKVQKNKYKEEIKSLKLRVKQLQFEKINGQQDEIDLQLEQELKHLKRLSQEVNEAKKLE